jgi:hypothetical protein
LEDMVLKVCFYRVMKGRDDDIFSENRGKIIRVRQKTDALLATSLLKLEVEIYPATMVAFVPFLDQLRSCYTGQGIIATQGQSIEG